MDKYDKLGYFCADPHCADKGFYELPVVCCNCDWRGTWAGTRGHEFSSGALGEECPNCGCKRLMRTKSEPAQ